MNAKLFALGLALTLVFAAAAYYVYEGVTMEPEVTVTGVSYRVDDSVSILGFEVPTALTFLVGLKVYNPNIISFTVEDVSYKVYVNDVAVGDGSIPEAVTVESKSRKSFTSEVDVSAAGALASLIDILSTGEASARVEGHADVKLPLVGVRRITFSQQHDVFKV
jgi:LEA14-like dessication related protein